MKYKTAVATALVIATANVAAQSQATDRKAVEAFVPLINTVRGAVRMQIEKGNGCLPWIRLARDGSDSSTYKDFGFSPELVKELDGAPNSRITPPIAKFAKEGNYTMSVLGRCGDDVVVAGRRLGVIELTLERLGQDPIMLRFPYELTETGAVGYRQELAAIGPAAPQILPAHELPQ